LALQAVNSSAVSFPVWISLGPLRIHPHFLFELLAYAVAGMAYWRGRRTLGDHVSSEARWALSAAAVIGALIGSRLLFWFEDPRRTLSQLTDFQHLVGGQTIVGGLLGGWLGVEWQKRRIGIHQPTGDLLAVPIALGAAVGRIGCFLSGLPDGTYGVFSSLPWAIDLGDGIPRHPTALSFMFTLAYALTRFALKASRGEVFLALMSSYLAFRLMIDGLKPGVTLVAGLTAIQVACVAGLAVALRTWHARRQRATTIMVGSE